MTVSANQSPPPSVQAAWELFQHLARGNTPIAIPSSLRLDGIGTEVLMDSWAEVAAYCATDVPDVPLPPSASNPWMATAMEIARRYRIKREEERAALQWRAIGPHRVVVTRQSTWLQVDGKWDGCVPHDTVVDMHVAPYAETRLEMRSKPRMRLRGPAAAFTGILVAYHVYGRQFAGMTPGLEVFYRHLG